jgi:hypothetical protein
MDTVWNPQKKLIPPKMIIPPVATASHVSKGSDERTNEEE